MCYGRQPLSASILMMLCQAWCMLCSQVPAIPACGRQQAAAHTRDAANMLWALVEMGHPAATAHMVDSVCLHVARLIQHTDAQQRPTAQNCTDMLSAVAKMGHSSAAIPEMVHSVCLHFAHLTQCSDVKQRPTALACANLLRTVAKMGHSPAAATEWVGSVCLHFTRLTQHSDAQQRPNAQDCACAVWALARLGHSSSAATEMMDLFCLQFACFVGSPIAQHRPTAQQVANLVWALGKVKHTPSDDRLLDGLCEYMQSLVCSHDQKARPNVLEIANTVWALAQLKHAPSYDVVTAMFDRLVDLCRTPGLHPDLQHISKCFIACAELGLVVKPACVDALLKHFMEMHASNVGYQEYCNLARCLAVMQCLDFNTFDAVLGKLTTKHTLAVQESSPKSSSAQMALADATQLYQALAWLGPPSASKQMKAWARWGWLRARLLTIAPGPVVNKVLSPGRTLMWAALALQEVPYKAHVLCGVYRADALLSPRDRGVVEVILMAEHPRDFTRNVPNRVLGSAALRSQLLSRHGTVVTIPYNPDNSTADSMAVDIKAAVEAKTGLPLDSFRS